MRHHRSAWLVTARAGAGEERGANGMILRGGVGILRKGRRAHPGVQERGLRAALVCAGAAYLGSWGVHTPFTHA